MRSPRSRFELACRVGVFALLGWLLGASVIPSSGRRAETRDRGAASKSTSCRVDASSGERRAARELRRDAERRGRSTGCRRSSTAATSVTWSGNAAGARGDRRGARRSARRHAHRRRGAGRRDASSFATTRARSTAFAIANARRQRDGAGRRRTSSPPTCAGETASIARAGLGAHSVDRRRGRRRLGREVHRRRARGARMAGDRAICRCAERRRRTQSGSLVLDTARVAAVIAVDTSLAVRSAPRSSGTCARAAGSSSPDRRALAAATASLAPGALGDALSSGGASGRHDRARRDGLLSRGVAQARRRRARATDRRRRRSPRGASVPAA